MTAISNDTTLYQTLGLSKELQQKSSDALQLEDFLDLMVTELTHQDPFKPMENSELASQISQFATVSGINELNDKFSSLSGSLLSDQSMQAANLIGRNVLVPLGGGYLETGGTIDGVVGLNDPASNVTVSVYNASGVLMREIELGTQTRGEVRFSWDGTTDTGDFAPAGQYQITARASANGAEFSPYVLTEAEVASVSIGSTGEGMSLNLKGLGPISFNDVAEIR
ncbi:MAG: flagellar hook assembly protein FlgD [Chromatiaceae bacterium]|nr:flagellar hook assembly protein FlgD [Gammaproteobacteria bacterium]MCP5427284.1 flagellar hook assembly protein FlgD [Chromatiaceae bacterium]MCB1871040.1 flagellar hook assembly protein FlgD [Gammaproteobacteria bacterium]MCB1879959.1 flagellar hook assembly protein FlgD [Gammaproteobacteria bacterium]MCB1905629.1 flagellar hook assembly protein FlgD [Gammaproteobacteria bacterium]